MRPSASTNVLRSQFTMSRTHTLVIAALAVTTLTVQSYVMQPVMSPRANGTVMGNSANQPVVSPRANGTVLGDSAHQPVMSPRANGTVLGDSAHQPVMSPRANGTVLGDSAHQPVMSPRANGTVLGDSAHQPVMSPRANGTVLGESAHQPVMSQRANGTVLGDYAHLPVMSPRANGTVLGDSAHQPVMSQRANGTVLGDYAQPTACGDNLCRCLGDYADCSGHSNGLQYIPRLPGTIRSLNFSHNHLEGIFQESFFENVTNLNKLYVNNNAVKYIRQDAFRTLTQLRLLNMQDNAMNYSSISTVLTVSTLSTLVLTYNDLGEVPDGFFDNATLPELRELFMFDNHIGDIKLSTFQHLQGLTHLGLANNHIADLKVDVVSDLVELNVNLNQLIYFPTTCHNENSSLFPRLAHLILGANRIKSVGRVCLPNLQVLVLSDNHFTVLPSGAFAGFPSLIQLYFESMGAHITSVAPDAFSNPSLQRISLEFNYMGFKHEYIDDLCFANCPNLSELQLSHNFLDTSEERFLRLFGHLAQMQYLFMENCLIGALTPRMFSGFPLLEKLALDRNKLTRIPDGTFDGLRKLTRLNLDNNQISVVPPALFSSHTRRRLTSLDLSDNPFACSCDVLWFQSWFLAHPALFARSWGTYTCFNVPGVDIGRFRIPAQACLLSQGAAVMVIVSVSLVLLVLALVVTVFRYRWHFRLLLHEAFRGGDGGETRRRRLETGRFQYDLFVSYDSDNVDWVLQHLVPQLEERRGLRLCLHQRDFTLGKNIVDNIADCVDSSKKVLMLFSASFVQSQWCQFELALCLRHVMDYDDALVIVCLDDVPSRDLTTAMMAVLKTTTYIQWVDDDNDAMTSFWGRLDVALQEIVPRRDVRILVD